MTGESRWLEARRAVPSCVACGEIEIPTGSLLALSLADENVRRTVEVVALAATELFEDVNVAAKTFGQLVTSHVTGMSDEPLEEVLICLESSSHLVVRRHNESDRAVIFTFEQEPGLAISLTRARLELRNL